MTGAIGTLVAIAQAAALLVLLQRLARGRTRLPAIEPVSQGLGDSSVSVVIPARNEAARIEPCLDGITVQGATMIEAIVVDGGSTDGTGELVDRAALRDPRVRRIAEPPRPAGRVGRPWAIAAGCAVARGEWILIVDADTAPKPGMVAGAVKAARAHGYDVVSFAPRILAPGNGARWLQAAFLTTLVYRFGPVGIDAADGDRAMANGQCLLIRRSVLQAAGGYAVAADSYCDDIRIVRHLAQHGARVGFLDGRRLFDVAMYRTAAETWRAWPRSLNMRDATRARWQIVDALFLVLTMVLPVPLLLIGGWLAPGGLAVTSSLITVGLLGVNGVLVATRVLLLAALRPSFAQGGAAFWLSPLADAPAALRVIATMMDRPREWRGSARASTTPAGRTAVPAPRAGA